MTPSDKPERRPYNAPGRAARASQSREAIIRAAKDAFERGGWSATTVRSIAAAAGVSPKTVEAAFGTKAALLRAVVDFSIRGDLRDVPINQREDALRIDSATSASAMLDLHAAHVRGIHERTAAIAWVVEEAARGDQHVGELWERMTGNRRSGVDWAASALLAKPDADPRLERADVESTFWLALEWGTYRTMTLARGLSPDEFELWLRAYYRRLLLA